MSIPLFIVVAAQIVTTASARDTEPPSILWEMGRFNWLHNISFAILLLQEPSPCPTHRARGRFENSNSQMPRILATKTELRQNGVMLLKS
jgi:peptidoglycan/LPS O-acetylase OafA/YrhL